MTQRVNLIQNYESNHQQLTKIKQNIQDQKDIINKASKFNQKKNNKLLVKRANQNQAQKQNLRSKKKQNDEFVLNVEYKTMPYTNCSTNNTDNQDKEIIKKNQRKNFKIIDQHVYIIDDDGNYNGISKPNEELKPLKLQKQRLSISGHQLVQKNSINGQKQQTKSPDLVKKKIKIQDQQGVQSILIKRQISDSINEKQPEESLQASIPNINYFFNQNSSPQIFNQNLSYDYTTNKILQLFQIFKNNKWSKINTNLQKFQLLYKKITKELNIGIDERKFCDLLKQNQYNFTQVYYKVVKKKNEFKNILKIIGNKTRHVKTKIKSYRD